MIDEPVDTKRTALLVMDFQRSIVSGLPGAASLLSKCGDLIAACRGQKIPIIYVTVKFRASYQEISARNKSFSQIKNDKRLSEHDENSSICDVIAPHDGDVVVIKRRTGAFSGSDLEVVLRSLDVDTLILAGVATSGVVLSTLRAAADMDYRLIVVEDCCADRDAEVHACLTQKVFPRQASVTDSLSLVEELKKMSRTAQS